jgi:nucleoside 2-deoxyribosyltransferase
MKIYFAGSIRGGRSDQELYSQIIKLLSNFGTVLTEHVGKKTLSILGEDGPNDEYIYNRDMKWLGETDVVVAEVTNPSLGVGYEIAKAEEWGKRVLCLYREADGRRTSAMITGSKRLVVRKYETLSEAEGIIREFLK